MDGWIRVGALSAKQRYKNNKMSREKAVKEGRVTAAQEKERREEARVRHRNAKTSKRTIN
jgi:hypothetical protein